MLAAGTISATVTVLVATSPGLRFAYRQPALHVALETTSALIALVAAYLFVGRFLRRRRLDDLLLADALGIFALTNFVFGAVPAAFEHEAPGRFTTWAALICRLLGATALAAAAVIPGRCMRTRRARWSTTVAPVAAIAAIAVVVAAVTPHLPVPVVERLAPEASTTVRLVGHPALLATQAAIVVLFAVAAVGFARRHGREGDEVIGWLAVAAVLGTIARLNYVLYPSLYSEWIYTGDGFRLLFDLTILFAAGREVRSYWRAETQAAAFEERRRIARDLHDGLAQELAFIGRNLKRLDRDDPVVRKLEGGAARALAESRRAISALTEPADRPLDAALAEVAQDVGDREGTHVALALANDVAATPTTREALVRIVSEAITNAARHGGADVVRVELEDRDRLRVRVVDTGRGFDAGRPARGFGLTSMRERAESLGGRLRVRSSPGEGTEVEVEL
jgi:signal transduction histidine kinase